MRRAAVIAAHCRMEDLVSYGKKTKYKCAKIRTALQWAVESDKPLTFIGLNFFNGTAVKLKPDSAELLACLILSSLCEIESESFYSFWKSFCAALRAKRGKTPRLLVPKAIALTKPQIENCLRKSLSTRPK